MPHKVKDEVFKMMSLMKWRVNEQSSQIVLLLLRKIEATFQKSWKDMYKWLQTSHKNAMQCHWHQL